MSLALIAISLLVGCDGAGSRGSATEEAALQFHELQAEVEALTLSDWMAEAAPEEMLDVVQKFIESADPTYLSATNKYNMLHLACMLKKPELARCLLLDGANPNTPTMIEGSAAETPLLFAIATDYTPEVSAEVINNLIDVLVAGGATLATPGSVESSITYNACLTCAHEAVYDHLLNIGVPRTGNETAEAAYRGWVNTLTRLIREEGGLTEAHYPLLTLVARMSGGYFPGDHLACARYLVEQGTPVDSVDEAGRTALFCLAASLPSLKESGTAEAAVELADWLLQQGANAYLRAEKDEEYPGFCAYDLLAAQPDVLQSLRDKGHKLEAPPVEIRQGEHLAADVCRASMMHTPAEVIAPYFDTIALLLNPSTELREQEIYTDALKNAIYLMASVDAAKTSQIVAAMPLWNDEQALKPHNHSMTALVYALQDTPTVVLPTELLLTKAEQMLANGEHENAASLIELLGRSNDCDELIDKLSTDSRLPIQAGAWGAKLYKAGLPSACDGSVASWLASNNRRADTPALQKALLLTSIEDLWYGNMSKEQISEFITAIRELGATQAADMYQAIASNLSNPDELDNLMNTQDTWTYELEIATAKFMLQHAAELLPSVPAATQAEQSM